MRNSRNATLGQLSLTLSSIDVQELLLGKAKNAVLAAAVDLMAQDMARLCGRPFARKSDFDLCHRGGSEETTLMLAGAKYPMRRPRARRDGKEVELPAMARLRDRELLDMQMLARLMKGVSTRDYRDAIDGFAEKTGISRSSVSRAFKRSSKKDLDSINGADLSGHRFVGIFVDGTGLGDATMVVAVGVTDDNQKVVLGVISGTTENTTVVGDLLTSIRGRGFTLATRRMLAVLDGGKALRAAVKAFWGDAVVIQRCWIHKLRNIKDYIPETNHGQLWRRMTKMMGLNSQVAAEKEFESLADWLATISPNAETSLREAGAELLTVHSLGLTGAFRKSMASTNIIESLIGVVKGKTKKVKNWGYHPRTGSKVKRDKALRWVATAIQAHRQKMRRVYGGKEQMNILITKLNAIDLMKTPA